MRTLKFTSIFILLLFTYSCGDKNQTEENKLVETSNEQAEESGSSIKTIVFYGDSLTAGYGLDESEAFPSYIQEKIDSLNLNYEVVNAGLSGETTAGGKNRLDWVLKQDVDIFVLELGANDGLRGVPIEETRQNLQDIIDTVRMRNPNVQIILAGMQIPPNMGREYTTDFRNIFPALAEKNNVELIPFLLEGVAGDPALNQQDRIHPTAEGQRILAENVWEVLKPLITN